MITDLIITNNNPNSYCRSIQGNGGEEELSIISSTGQDGRCGLVIVAAQVDGHAATLYAVSPLTPRSGLPRNGADFMRTVRRVVIAWACTGIQPSAKQTQQIAQDVDRILAELFPE